MAPLNRPPDDLLLALVDALALPGLGPHKIAEALQDPANDPAEDPADDPAGLEFGLPDRRRPALDRMGRLERLARGARAKLREGEVVGARGWARRALETIHAMDVHVLLPGDGVYPDSLARLAQPPCPIFARGRLDLLDTPMVAVVGTRGASAYGREAAHRIAWGIAAAGATVVSGLARGIDGVAHRAAGPARTVGVVGCGIDVVFPREHAALQEAIGREGLLLSELLPGTPPVGHNFPRRNRIIAGLARGVVVVEAPRKSGALLTAKHAQGEKPIFVVPGPIGVRTSEGSNALINDGGTLVTSAAEVLGGLHLPLPPEDCEREIPPAGLEGQGLALWRTLGREPRHVDDISRTVGLDTRRSLASLLSLEVQGHARQLPGMRFVRV